MICPECNKQIDRIKVRTVSIQYLKLEDGKLALAIGEFENQRAIDAMHPPNTFYCPHSDTPLLNIKTKEKAILVLKGIE